MNCGFNVEPRAAFREDHKPRKPKTERKNMQHINTLILKRLGLALAAVAGITTVAQAQLVTWPGEIVPTTTIEITATVTEFNSGPLKGYYDYKYLIDDTTTKNLTQFEVNFPGSAAFVTSVSAGGLYDVVDQDIVWTGSPYLVTAGNSATVSFISPDKPVLYTGSAIDDGPGPWGPTSKSEYISVVPEPSTLMAGATMLIPFGASTLRFLRKNKKA